MKEICQLLIYKSKDDDKYKGVISGLKKQIYQLNPHDALIDIFDNSSYLQILKNSNEYNLFDFLEFSNEDQEQYNALIEGLHFLINECIDLKKTFSLSDIELLKPFYDITHIFTPISEEQNADIVSPPVHYSTFPIYKALTDGRALYHDFFYQCFSPADIIFSLLHFQTFTQLKYGRCKHCQRLYTTNNLRNEYCNRNSQYPNFEKYSCYDAKKEILRQLSNKRRKIYKNLSLNDARVDIFAEDSKKALKKARKEPTYENLDKCFKIIDESKWNKKNAFRNTVRHSPEELEELKKWRQQKK